MAEVNIFLLVISSIGLDLLIGDPLFLVHPVQVMGFFISKSSKYCVCLFNKKEDLLKWSGLFIAFITILISFSAGKLLEIFFLKSNNNILWGLAILFGLSSCLATKSLISRVREISYLINNLINKKFIDENSLKKIVSKVQKIVSRDVTSSSLEDLLRSTVESLTENSVDGIFGPLFWIFIGTFSIHYSIYLPGPLSLGFTYKAISTLDSMIGYKYDFYKKLGFFSAKIEDFATYIPARLVVYSLPFVKKRTKKYYDLIQTVFEEGHRYESPNAGISEGIFAHVANVQLGGTNIYPNGVVNKPILNSQGEKCTFDSVEIIKNLIFRLLLLWIFLFTVIFLLINLQQTT